MRDSVINQLALNFGFIQDVKDEGENDQQLPLERGERASRPTVRQDALIRNMPEIEIAVVKRASRRIEKRFA